MRDRNDRIDENLLQRTAGPYIRATNIREVRLATAAMSGPEVRVLRERGLTFDIKGISRHLTAHVRLMRRDWILFNPGG